MGRKTFDEGGEALMAWLTPSRTALLALAAALGMLTASALRPWGFAA